MKRKFFHISLYILLSLTLFFIFIITGFSSSLYHVYEGFILQGHYEGETKAAFYMVFLMKWLLPSCFLLVSVFYGAYLWKRKSNL
ncbi:hypothetical protein [Yersinia sp. 2105 StPb PI]|uniref:hypothetical protein n=1 Tax=Yersinia sp. 2105 StPb PI TaxID=2507058 RepID=UPI00119CE8F7|nr:hypothetical protein [Yersinia sp. 2105 StPb PI]